MEFTLLPRLFSISHSFSTQELSLFFKCPWLKKVAQRKKPKKSVARRKCSISRAKFCTTFYEWDISAFKVHHGQQQLHWPELANLFEVTNNKKKNVNADFVFFFPYWVPDFTTKLAFPFGNQTFHWSQDSVFADLKVFSNLHNIKPFVPNAPFLYPLKTSENLTVF